MASKYLTKYPVPQDFTEVLHDFTREVLRLQPIDIVDFAAAYFQSKECGADFEWPAEKSKDSRLRDYPRIRKEPVAAAPVKKEVVEKKEEVAPPQKPPTPREELPPRTASAKSNASDSSARAREYVNEVVDRIFKRTLSEKNFN